MILDSTGPSLQILLAGAVTTNQLQCTVNYTDYSSTQEIDSTVDVLTNGAVAVNVLLPPPEHWYVIENLSVFNADTATATVRIRYSGILSTFVNIALPSGSTLTYDPIRGWRTFNNLGSEQTG